MKPPDAKTRYAELLERALDMLHRQTGLRGRVLQWEPTIPGEPGAPKYRPDALVQIQVHDQTLQFIVEIKIIDRPQMITQVRGFWPPGVQPPLLFVAPYLTAETADRCRELKLFFLDGEGKGYIDVPGLYIFITGRKRPTDIFQEERGRLTNPAALRVVFTILCQTKLLNATYRDIADAARVALGTIGPVIKDLEARKYVATLGMEIPKRKIIDQERLFREWVTLYPAVLRPKLNARRFRAPDLKWTDTADLHQYGAYWGGEIAAKRITRYLQPETATIYITRQATPLIADQRLRADVNGNVEILDVFWNADRIPHQPDLVPPLLVYADLTATTEGRNLEAAKLIFDEHIGPNLHRTT